MLRSLRQLAIRILKTPEAEEKCRLTRETVEAYRSGKIIQIVGNNEEELPEKPFRAVEEIRVEDALGSERARLFADDVLSIALKESTHFERLSTRLLEQYGTKYGDFVAHDALAESMLATNDDILARLAIVHLAPELRYLNIFDLGRKKLYMACDTSTEKVLIENCVQEFGRLYQFKAMHSWFVSLAEHRGLDPRDTFAFHIRDPVCLQAQGLKPPFHVDSNFSLDPDDHLKYALFKFRNRYRDRTL